MPGRITQAVAAAAMIVAGPPVIAFSTLTTFLAVTLLSIRGSILGLEFLLALALEWWSAATKAKPPLPRSPTALEERSGVEFRAPPSASRSRTSSFGDAASLKRLSYRSDTSLSQHASGAPGTPVNRDFEGVGGWRYPADHDDQSLWMNMNSRLELTRAFGRHHRRSTTGGSLHTPALTSPELFARTPRPRPYTSGNASPQSYFSLHTGNGLHTSSSVVTLQPKRFSAIGNERWDQRPTAHFENDSDHGGSPD